MKDLKQFICTYSVSKTLRFELRPVGRTQEWIEKNGVVENDERKAENYPQVKKLIDEYHKVCISESLKGVHLDWHPLKDGIQEYQKTKYTTEPSLLCTTLPHFGLTFVCSRFAV